ncbi:hypothetical protein Bca52824_063278 [Brassica carinata]|uniref:Uncharacterized protein n=1 Tax=Brassica carinata TaxID=52824 RepID=A0A8X7QFS6_BRACI|nr:hypothetical protein Bca52824_063278 [Brassica carinata]
MEEADTSRLIRVWMLLILQQMWRHLRSMLLEEARERFRMKEPSQERRSCCFLGRYTQSANGEYGEHVQREDRQHGDRGFTAREAISLRAYEAAPKSKIDEAAPKTKTAKLPQRKRSIKLKLKLQQRKRYFLKESVELDVLVSRMPRKGAGTSLWS